MNDWAHYFAIAPSRESIGLTNHSVLSGEAGYARKLLLCALLGSLFLVVGKSAYAFCERTSPLKGTEVISPVSNSAHVPLSPLARDILSSTWPRALGAMGLPVNKGLLLNEYVTFPHFSGYKFAILDGFRIAAEDSNPQHPNSKIILSNGAVLAYQVAASIEPNARNGVATAGPQLEGANVKNFQICTRGYPVMPGIPKPVCDRGAQERSPAKARFLRRQANKANKNTSIRNL